jgi:hypothetical protein
MATAWRSKWLDWQPEDEIISTLPGTELTKLTESNFVNSVSATLEESRSISDQADDPSAWRKVFHQWRTRQCVSKDRCFGGVSSLHIHFAEWAIAHDAVPCTRPTFEVLLGEAGFLVCDGMVSGLILAEDWHAAHWKPDPPRPLH